MPSDRPVVSTVAMGTELPDEKSSGPAALRSGVGARIRASRGARSGLGLAIAVAILTGGGYLYNLACIRYLGSRRFGDVATMLSLGVLIAFPLGGVQNLIARETAHLKAIGDIDGIRALFRRSVKWTLIAGLVITGGAMAATAPISRLVSVDSLAVVALGLSAIVFFAVGAILYGFVQGMQRFRGLGAAYALSGMARPVLVAPALVVGFGAAGALGVNALAAALAVAIAAFVVRDLWSGHYLKTVPPPRLDRKEVATMVGGTLAFASLTNVDVVLANALLDDHAGGVYAAAALAAKLLLLISTVVATVLLPKATARVAESRSAVPILVASIAATVMLSVVAVVSLALVPERLVVWAFGADFVASTALLGLFAAAMGLAGIVNVYLLFYLAHRDPRFPMLVGAAAVTQIIAVVLWHPSPRGIILVTLFCCAGVLAVHETFFRYSTVRNLRLLRSGTRAVAG